MNELADPVGSLLEQRRPLDKEQATQLYNFLDASLILRVAEKEGYTAESKVRRLCEIVKKGSSTASIAAMKELDAMLDRAAQHRSLPFLGDSSGSAAGLSAGYARDVPAFPSTPDEIAVTEVTAVRATLKRGRRHHIIEGEIVHGQENRSESQPADGSDEVERGNERDAGDGAVPPGPGDSDAGDADGDGHCYDDAGGGADPYPQQGDALPGEDPFSGGGPFGGGFHRPPVQDGGEK